VGYVERETELAMQKKDKKETGKRMV